MHRLFQMLQRAVSLPATLLSTAVGMPIVEAACSVIASAFDGRVAEHAALRLKCESLLERAMARPDDSVHERAAEALHTVAKFGGQSEYFALIRKRWDGFSTIEQQGWSLALGALNHQDEEHASAKVLTFLFELLKPPSPQYATTVEARRNACSAIAELLSANTRLFTKDATRDSAQTLHVCLEDYTIDQRGDVGSWVRMSALKALGKILAIAAEKEDVGEEVRAARLAILKQMSERMGSVRSAAAHALLEVEQPQQASSDTHVDELLACIGEASELELREPEWLFPRLASLLHVPQYMPPISSGFLSSIGSIADSTVSRTLLPNRSSFHCCSLRSCHCLSAPSSPNCVGWVGQR